MIISRLEVGSGTGAVTGRADGRRAIIRVPAVGRQDGETVLGELGVGLHVDAGQIPVDGVGALGVLELEHVGLVGIRGKLDGDTTAIGVGSPGLGIGTTVGREGLHGADIIRDGPGVDVLSQVVGDQDSSTGGLGVIALDHHAGRKGRGQSSKGSSQAESLGEHHVDEVGIGI